MTSATSSSILISHLYSSSSLGSVILDSFLPHFIDKVYLKGLPLLHLKWPIETTPPASKVTTTSRRNKHHTTKATIQTTSMPLNNRLRIPKSRNILLLKTTPLLNLTRLNRKVMLTAQTMPTTALPARTLLPTIPPASMIMAKSAPTVREALVRPSSAVPEAASLAMRWVVEL